MREIATPWGPAVLVLEGEQPDPALFSAEELREAQSFRLEKRRTEWLVSRAAAKRLACELGACSDPRTCRIADRRIVDTGRDTGWHVSLSHSSPYAGAAIGRQPVGIDVQVVRPFLPEAAHLFLTPEEIEVLERCRIAERLLHFWCAKEAAWKRRSPEFVTLRQVPLVLLEERKDSLRFDDAETLAAGDVIVAVSGPPARRL